MSNNTQPRNPRGISTGGQWRATSRPEGNVALSGQPGVPDPSEPTDSGREDVELSAEEHRRLAREADQEAYDSFERCDTDGFLSQWASGLTAQQHRLAAEIADAGGRRSFRALFDLEGNLVPAKEIPTRYGTAWGILEGDDPHGAIAKWVNQSRARSATKRIRSMEAKGYREGRVMARARAAIVGSGQGLSGSAWVAPVRTDGGFSRDVEVLDDGRRAAATAGLVDLAQELRVRPEDLAADVSEAKAREVGNDEAEHQAWFVNNEGLEAQIGYLVEANGPEALRQRLEVGSRDQRQGRESGSSERE